MGSEDEGDFAAGWGGLELSREVGGGAAEELLEFFGDFAGDAGWAGWGEGGELVEGFGDAVGGVEVDVGDVALEGGAEFG